MPVLNKTEKVHTKFLEYSNPDGNYLNSASILKGQKQVPNLKGFIEEDLADLEDDFSFDFCD